jgi:hypothetical protein
MEHVSIHRGFEDDWDVIYKDDDGNLFLPAYNENYDESSDEDSDEDSSNQFTLVQVGTSIADILSHINCRGSFYIRYRGRYSIASSILIRSWKIREMV